MGLFGNKSPFDPSMPYGTPGIGDGIPGNTPMGGLQAPSLDSLAMGMATAPQGNASLTAPMQAPDTPKKGGLFGRKSLLWNALGAIGDGLRAANDQPMEFAQALMQARQHQQSMAEKAADRQAQYQQEMDLARFKATLPPNNDTVADYNFRAQTLGKDAADQWLKNAGDPIVTVQLPGNRIYSGPRSGMAAALTGGVAPTSITEDDWNKGTPVGGAGSNAGGNFRP